MATSPPVSQYRPSSAPHQPLSALVASYSLECVERLSEKPHKRANRLTIRRLITRPLGDRADGWQRGLLANPYRGLLGAYFVGSFYDEEVQHVLGLPPEVRPIGIIPVGYCAEGPRKFPRRSRQQIVHSDRYGLSR